MKNLHTIVVVVLVALCLPAYGQNHAVTWVYAKTADKPAVESVSVTIPNLFELWVVDFRSPNPLLDLVGPQLQNSRTNYLFRAGPYLRFSTDDLYRAGIAGLLVWGDRDNWRLISPFYTFQELGSEFNATGIWLPNLRVTYPIGNGLRAGIGLAMTSIEKRPTSLVVGPYFSVENHGVTLQLRFGRQISPEPLSGQLQLFSAITYRF